MSIIEKVVSIIITLVAVYLLFPTLIDAVLKAYTALQGSNIAGIPILSYVILIVPILILLRLVIWIKEALM